jgi:hypothetical protein
MSLQIEIVFTLCQVQAPKIVLKLWKVKGWNILLELIIIGYCKVLLIDSWESNDDSRGLGVILGLCRIKFMGF